MKNESENCHPDGSSRFLSLSYGEAFMLSFQRYCHEAHDNVVGEGFEGE